MNEHQDQLAVARRLSSYISTWLYSVGSPPEPVNSLFIQWVDHNQLPTPEELERAIAESEAVLKRRMGAE